MRYEQLKTLVPAPGRTYDPKACLEAFPVLEKAKVTPQDLSYHGEGDVWAHTCLVLDALVASSDYAESSHEQREILFLAALLHDVSKADTTVIDPVSGRIGQPGHSKRGAIDARVLLWRAGVPFVLREAVCRLIAVHQVPFYALATSKVTPERLVHRLSWELDVRLLAALAEADMRGRICADQHKVLDDIALFRELAQEEGCYGRERVYADVHTRLNYARHAKGHPDFSLHQNKGSRVIVMCGLPASGKNTWLDKHDPDLPVVSFDDAREELGLRHGQNEGAAAHRAVDKAKELLRKKAPFAWNATHLSQQMRDKTLDLLYSYEAEVTIVYLENSFEELRRRNAARDSSLKQTTLERMFHRWEAPVPWEAHEVRYLTTA